MKKIGIVVISLLLLAGLSFGGDTAYKKITTPEKVHYHAGFVVFQNDKKIDFSDFKYMRVKPCDEEKNHKDTPEDIQAEKAHLHDLVGDVVHIEAAGAYWKDLFTNIKYPIDYSKTTSYLNGTSTPNFQNRKINPDDSLVVLIGENANNHTQDAVGKEYIEKKAKESVDCGE